MKIDENSESGDLFSLDSIFSSINKNTTNLNSEINLFVNCPKDSNISESNQNFDDCFLLINCNKGIEEYISSSINKNYSENNLYVNGSKNIRQNKEVLSDSYNQKKRDVIFLNKKRSNFNIFTPAENEDKSDSRKLINEVKNSKIKYYYYENNKSKKNILDDRKSQDNESGKRKKKKNIFARKDCTESRMKKVKSHFHKILFKKTNELFKELFEEGVYEEEIEIKKLPQSFISKATKKINKPMMKKTYKDLLSHNFQSKKDVDSKNYKHNKNKISYLKKKNFERCEFLNMTYENIFEEYLNSKEFENDISDLMEIEQKEYVKNYIIKAINYISYYNKL